MSLPYSSIVPISGVVQTPAFAAEKQHMLLAMVNSLIPSTVKALEFKGITAFGAYFGQDIPEYVQVQKYFSRLSKTGLAPDKVVVARWFKEDSPAFYKGQKVTTSVQDLKTIGDGSFNITLDGETFEVSVNLSSITSYSDAATAIQTAIRDNSIGGTAYSGATVTYSSITGGFIITSGTSGTVSTVSAITAGTTGTDYSEPLGLSNADLSQGANAETFTQFCDRIYHANTAGFSITTLEKLEEEDILTAVEWLQTVQNGQTYNTRVRLVFNMNDLTEAQSLQTKLTGKTGYVVCYDPKEEYVNILDCSIAASVDFNATNGTINFNFQPADGYTPVTDLGTVTDYQSGQTNMALWEELSNHCISCVYSVGFGSQETVYYGKGLMQGSFGTEDVQCNEAWLEQDIQVAVINAFDSLNKVKLQGQDAVDLISSLISPSFGKGKKNGAIAQNGTLSETDRLNIVQATGVAAAADAVANNGYYYKINDLTTEDIALRRVQIVSCYLCGGVVNEVRIINNIYGA